MFSPTSYGSDSLHPLPLPLFGVGVSCSDRGIGDLRLPTAAVPLEEAGEAGEWRNTFSLMDMNLELDFDVDLGREDGDCGGRERWDFQQWEAEEEGEDHSLLSDDLSCFSSHSFATFMSPLSMHSASAPGRTTLSPAAYSHMADIEEEEEGGREVQEEGSWTRSSIIEGINVIIDDGKAEADALGGSSQCSQSYCQSYSQSQRGSHVALHPPHPPLSYTEALLTPSTPSVPSTVAAGVTVSPLHPLPRPPSTHNQNSASTQDGDGDRDKVKEREVESVYQRTVHWPHPSFRYMFLADHMKQRVQTTIRAVECKVSMMCSQCSEVQWEGKVRKLLFNIVMLP